MKVGLFISKLNRCYYNWVIFFVILILVGLIYLKWYVVMYYKVNILLKIKKMDMEKVIFEIKIFKYIYEFIYYW